MARGTGRERDGDDLAALAHHSERAVSALDAERVDIGTESLRNPEPIDREQ